jgi:hypothetical protein
LPGRKYLKKKSVLQKRKLKIQSNEIHEQKKRSSRKKNSNPWTSVPTCMIRFKKTFDGIFSHYDNTEINLGTQ